ncbi:MAG: signal peptide peptidase SppA [Bacteroidetes bacterium]|uniref:Signal peptide peptidase SppA n=1 Tax=Candidatus Cryptobacteroides gallistercoris TaxID=2840765 RepID=A0A940DPD7_9BACT|nr:signal peptide peptidase SppA [Candidatus Cryptobacteroides gallistercoris]
MKEFFKMTLASMLGFLVVSVVMTVFGFMIIGAIAAIGSEQPVMPRSAVLTIDMGKIALTEQNAPADPLAMLQNNNTTPVGIWNAVSAINAAAGDPEVKMIFMKPDMASGGLAELEEFRQALMNFRNSGKAIVSYIENPTNAGYYLASVSDKIYMTSYEGGMTMITGLSTQLIFLKDILDKLGINVQLIRHGKYKSAGEMYIRSGISPENREQNQEMVNSIWQNWSAEMAQARGLATDAFNGLIDGLKLNFPSDYLENGLADELMTKEELREKLCTLSGNEEFSDIPFMPFSDYVTLKSLPNLKADKKIAVIYASGNIIEGDDKSQVGGDRFASIIAGIRNDESVKAVVFRVNSPGGSVLASEKIKNEIDLLRQEKPVIASFGNYAASGGYWISNSCDYIFSNAGTLTGSIGVFSMIPEFSGTLEDIAHVNITTISSNEHGDMYSGTRALNQTETAYMQASVERIYDKFTSVVAEGRDMEVQDVDAIAQGRVWSGADAVEIGLVDEIGSLNDAILYAAAAAGHPDLSSWQIAEYPKPMTTFELLLESLAGGNGESVFSGTPLENVAEAFSAWDAAESGKVYARMPYEISIR